MKSKFTKVTTSIIVVMMLILTAIPFASAATLLDESKAVSVTLNCSKPGYTFTVYKVAKLESMSSTPYETKYTSFVPEISDEIMGGDTKSILSKLDNIETMPNTAPVQQIWTSSATATTNTDLKSVL